MTDPAREALRADLNAEYGALLKLVSEFDARLVTIKSWSITVSLAGIGLGFQQGHYALFALASGAATCFWLIESINKRHQIRYYPRMREIETIAAELNPLLLGGKLVSSPQVDWKWEKFSSSELPQMRPDDDFAKLLRRVPFLPHVLVPAVVIVIAGAILFLLGAGGFFGAMQI